MLINWTRHHWQCTATCSNSVNFEKMILLSSQFQKCFEEAWNNLYRPNVNISKKLQTITENDSIMEYFQMMRKQNQSGHKIVTVCMYLSCNWSNNHHIATRVLYRNSRHLLLHPQAIIIYSVWPFCYRFDCTFLHCLIHTEGIRRIYSF